METQVGSKQAVTKQAFADSFSISVRTVEYLIAAKELRAIKIGRSVRIPADEVRAFTRKSHATHAAD